jgi:hypothetical protein
MSLFKYLFLSLFFIGCGNVSNSSKQTIKISSEALLNFPSEKGCYIIISCVRCSCFNTVIRNFKAEEKEYFSHITILADTTCTKTNIPALHTTQKLIDGISEDIYNITLVKRMNGQVVNRIIQTDESSNFFLICKKFFSSTNLKL